jgi:uroporphyrin-III C-methyltransferase / precorrin-2 dehydrogenase / sirohydrochlorin ferrochelatase
MQADVIVHDALVPEAVVAMGRRDAERILAGKRKGAHSMTQDEINRLLVDLGREGKRVVRLKSGDPLIFGRAGEEMAAHCARRAFPTRSCRASPPPSPPPPISNCR